MSTSAAPLPAVRAALLGLVDYAGLFPPAKLDMVPAVREYAQARRGEFAWMLGRFIVPHSRLSELRAAIPPEEAPFRLSVILDGDRNAAQLADFSRSAERFRVEIVEIPAPADEMQALASAFADAGLSQAAAYVEWPRRADWESMLPEAMERAARLRFGAKVRCGGLVHDAFPTPGELAAFVAEAASHGVPFKATAGLHHPVRHDNLQSGFKMHGFLNLLFAAVFAQSGAPRAALAECLADEKAPNFRFTPEGIEWRDVRADVRQIESARSGAFVSYGSCSFDEPVTDLQSMELI